MIIYLWIWTDSPRSRAELDRGWSSPWDRSGRNPTGLCNRLALSFLNFPPRNRGKCIEIVFFSLSLSNLLVFFFKTPSKTRSGLGARFSQLHDCFSLFVTDTVTRTHSALSTRSSQSFHRLKNTSTVNGRRQKRRARLETRHSIDGGPITNWRRPVATCSVKRPFPHSTRADLRWPHDY